MKPLFQSSLLQTEFEKQGFVRVPLLDAEQAEELLQLYKTTEDEHSKIALPFITSSHSNNYELIQKVDKMIAGIMAPAMAKVLCNYQLLFGNFLVKMPGANSTTPAHQDTTFVDETKFSSITVWVSLQDTDETNGCMRFVPGSHRFMHTLRPTHQYPWPFENVKPQLEKMMLAYPSKKGEAFIFHHGVIHASFANTNNTPRVAAIMAAYPEDADLLMLFSNPDNINRVQQYRMTKEAYLHFVKGQPPAMGKLMKTVDFDFKQLTAESFERLVNPNSSFLSKIKNWAQTLAPVNE